MAIELINGIEIELQGGTRGLQGYKGDKGDPGNSFDPMIGDVETLSPGSQATVTTNVDEEGNILYFNFGIPQGNKGDTGGANFTTFDIIDGKLIAYPENPEEQPIVLGTVAMETKGTYDADAYYEYLNIVNYNGDTYVAKQAAHNIIPTDTDYWQYIAGGAAYSDIVDNLDSNDATKMLSAKQGKVLNEGKVQVFDTVALMKATTLKNGMTVQTLGYYAANDGGGAVYKITDTEILTDYQEELENGLYATLIQNDVVNIKQFGVVCDGETDDYQKFQNAINKLNGNVKELIFNNEEDLILSHYVRFDGLDGINFNFKGKIHRLSSTERNDMCFQVWNCKNLNFNNSYIYSTRDKTEEAPADHTRQSTLGSNILGYHIKNCENITFNNVVFENLASDFFNVNAGTDENVIVSKNIKINGWISKNCSLPLYMSSVYDLYINNAIHNVAPEMGDGDHCLYLSKDVKNVTVENSSFIAPDNYYGVLIGFRHSGTGVTNENAPKNLTMDNCYFKGRSLITLWYNSNAKILNSTIDLIDYTTDSNANVLMLAAGTPSLLIDNCKFNNINNYLSLLLINYNAELRIINSVLNESSTHPDTLLFMRSNGAKVYLENNTINTYKGLFYVATNGGNYIVLKNNIINQANNDAYVLSIQSDGNIVTVENNIVNNTITKNNFFANSGSVGSTIDCYFNIIRGYRGIANATEIVAINNDYNANLTV